MPKRVLQKVAARTGCRRRGAEKSALSPLSCTTSTEAQDPEHFFRPLFLDTPFGLPLSEALFFGSFPGDGSGTSCNGCEDCDPVRLLRNYSIGFKRKKYISHLEVIFTFFGSLFPMFLKGEAETYIFLFFPWSPKPIPTRSQREDPNSRRDRAMLAVLVIVLQTCLIKWDTLAPCNLSPQMSSDNLLYCVACRDTLAPCNLSPQMSSDNLLYCVACMATEVSWHGTDHCNSVL